MKTKTIILIILLFVSINAGVYYITKINTDNIIDIILKDKLKTLDTYHKILLETQRSTAQAAYKSTIRIERFIEIISEANSATKEKKAQLREEFSKLLTAKYDLIKESGVLQYQFLLPDNESFYRTHKPSEFGDNLTDVREDFKYVNETKKPIRGFTQGRISHAFRNVFPIFDKNHKHIGAMEVSFSSENFQEYLNKISDVHSHFLVDKRIFNSKTWQKKELLLKYIQSPENENYMLALESTHNRDKYEDENNQKLQFVRKEIDSKIILGKAFNLYITGFENHKHADVISFLPIKNINKKTVAWVVSYEENSVIYSTLVYAQISRIVSLLLSLLIIYFLVKQLRSKKELESSNSMLKEQHKYLQSIIDGVDDPIMVIKEDYTIEIMNSTLRESSKHLNIADPLNPKCYEISHHQTTPCDGFHHPCPLRDVLQSKQNVTVVHNHDTKDGENRYIELSASPLFDKEKNCIGIIESARDITAHLEVQDELREQKSILDHQAHHDALTGLPNRLLFTDRLAQAIQKAKRKNSKFALLFIDLDHFKEINDSLGHDIGDEVLKEVTARLKEAKRDEDTLARLGGDEFTVILEELKYAQDASLISNKILESLSKPINLNNNNLYVSSSIGISIYPDDGESPQSLLKFADSAMYKAKDEGRNNFQYYNSSMTELAFERILMETSLRDALKNEEFVVYYQPQVQGTTNRLIGMEALVRWQHPTMGLVPPDKFIALAESTGLIVELDRFVMKTAMMQLAQWYRDGLNPGKLAMNLAVKQLQKEDFIAVFKELIKETKCNSEWLELEVTESQIMTNPQEAIKVLKKISDLGIELAVDDFGTGYSSLAYLKRLPIDKLKIDQVFVRDLPGDEEDAGITKAVIALSKSLNLKVIAEGVETKEQRDFIVENGCENIQGYFYSRPVSSEEFEDILKNGF